MVRDNTELFCPFGLEITEGCKNAGICIHGMLPISKEFAPESLTEEEIKEFKKGNLLIYKKHKDGERCPYAQEIMEDREVVNCNYGDTAEGLSDIKWYKGSSDAFKYWQGNVWGDYFTPLGRGWSGADYYVPGTSPVGYLSLNAKNKNINIKQNNIGSENMKKNAEPEITVTKDETGEPIIVVEEDDEKKITTIDPPGKGDVGIETIEVSEDEVAQENKEPETIEVSEDEAAQENKGPETITVEEEEPKEESYGPKEIVFEHEKALEEAEEALKKRQDEKDEDVKWDGNLKTFMEYMKDAMSKEVPEWVRDIETESEIVGKNLKERKRLLNAAKDWWVMRSKEIDKALKMYHNKKKERKDSILNAENIDQAYGWKDVAERTLKVFDRLLHPEKYEGNKRRGSTEETLEKTAVAEMEKEDSNISKAIQTDENLGLSDIIAYDEKRKIAESFIKQLKEKFANVDRLRRQARREALVKEAYTPQLTVVPDKFLWDLTRDLINHIVSNNGDMEEAFTIASKEFSLTKREAYQMRNLLKDAGYPVRWSSRLFFKLPENYNA